MKQVWKYFGRLAVSALACALLSGTAMAVPAPSIPNSDPGTSPVELIGGTSSTATTLAMVGDGKPALGGRARELSLARGVSRDGTAYGTVPGTSSTRASRSKAKYLMSGLVLAAMATPALLHRSDDGPSKGMTVQTQVPQSGDATGSTASWTLGTSLNGRGGMKGGNDNGKDKGNGRGDLNNNQGDDDDDEGDGDEVCDTGDGGGDSEGDGEEVGDHTGGDSGDDCDEEEVDNGGHEGGGGDGGPTGLPEPGTVPLVGAGLLAVLALRRRNP